MADGGGQQHPSKRKARKRENEDDRGGREGGEESSGQTSHLEEHGQIATMQESTDTKQKVISTELDMGQQRTELGRGQQQPTERNNSKGERGASGQSHPEGHGQSATMQKWENTKPESLGELTSEKRAPDSHVLKGVNGGVKKLVKMFEKKGLTATSIDGDICGVKNCTRKFYEQKKDDSYRMDQMPRGQALIINVNRCLNRHRKGTNVDRDNMQSMLEQLHFKVTVLNDVDGLTAVEITKHIKEFLEKPEHSSADACVICLLSHGDNDYILGTDGIKIYLNNIFMLFSDLKCPVLQEKPKIFFIQAYRETMYDPEVRDKPDSPPFTHTSNPEQKNVISDMIICYTTMQEYTDMRDVETDMRDVETDESDVETDERDVETNESDVETDESDVETDERDVETDMRDVETDKRDVETGESDVETDERDIETDERDVETDERDVETDKRDVESDMRDVETDSLFIQEVVKVFTKYAHCEDVCTMFNRVNRHVSSSDHSSQIFTYKSYLCKPYLYFFPGISSSSQ